jgi:hypothetical protein
MVIQIILPSKENNEVLENSISEVIDEVVDALFFFLCKSRKAKDEKKAMGPRRGNPDTFDNLSLYNIVWGVGIKYPWCIHYKNVLAKALSMLGGTT